MNTIAVYIDDYLIDLKDGQSVVTSIKKLDIGDLSKRSITHTNKLNAVWSKTNCTAFGILYDEHLVATTPYTLLSCKVVIDGVETIVGSAVVTDASKKEGIEFQVLEESFDLFNELDGLTMDVVAPITASGWRGEARDLVRATTSGIISAVINWGVGVYASTRFLPSFYYHTLVTSALEYTGLTLSGDILTDTDFTELIVPFPSGEFDAPDSVTDAAPIYSSKGAISTGTGTSLMPALPSDIQVNDLLLLVVVLQGTGITIDGVTDWTVTESGSFSNSSPTTVGTSAVFYRTADGTETTPTVSVSGGTPTQIAAVIYKFRGDGTYLTIDSGNAKTDGNGNSTITWDSVTVSGTKRTLIALLAQLDSSDPGTPTGYTNNASDTVDSGAIQVALECSTLGEVIIGSSVTATGGSANGWITFHFSIYNNAPDSVDWNQYLSPIKASDLIKDFFNRFLLIHKLVGNTLYLKELGAIINDRVNALDWSAKLVNRDDEKISFELPYGQNNYFNYGKSDDVFEENLGRGNLSIANTTLPSSKDIYDTIFQNSQTVTVSSYKTAYIKAYTAESTSIEDIQNDPGIRLLTLKSRTSEPSVTFSITARTDYKLGYFVDSLLSKDTGWQYFLDQKYPELSTALQTNKVIKKYFRLTAIDINSYDPFKMVFDGQGYYIVNKIPRFIPGKITEVELFKVG